MAISPRGVIRSTSCLFYGGVFEVDGSNGAISGLAKSKMAAEPESSNGDISATGHPIHSMFGAMVEFLGSAVGGSNGAISSWAKFNRYIHVRENNARE